MIIYVLYQIKKDEWDNWVESVYEVCGTMELAIRQLKQAISDTQKDGDDYEYKIEPYEVITE